MNAAKRIVEVRVIGLLGVFNYRIRFPDGSDTVIIIAPNGHGKTALLALIKDCVSLNPRRIDRHVFTSISIKFADSTQWYFEKVIDEEKEHYLDLKRRQLRYEERDSIYEYERMREFELRKLGETRSATRVILQKFDEKGKIVRASSPDISGISPRLMSRVLDRLPGLSMSAGGRVRDLRRNRTISYTEAFEAYYNEITSDPQIMDMIFAADPSLAWPGVSAIECLFIETQRLLYQRERSEVTDKTTSQEEIVRQSQALATLLQKSSSAYASTSQTLDRSFPNRLIARARSGKVIDPDRLRDELSAVEARRKSLTEAGILLEQSDAIVTTDGDLLPTVVDALQIYVEDSQKKLGEYEEIFPKMSVFLDLINAKLKPKRIGIGRDFEANVWRDKKKLNLEGLSSGEKHEFIMLFKLIFETQSGSLVLIDEPEISLHVLWQLEFMQDLRSIQAANPFQSIIATHSPQIFQGFNSILIDLADQVA